jgi:hypothetical protein
MLDLTHLTERAACFRPCGYVFTSENLTHLTEQTYFPKSPNKKVLKKSAVKVGQFGQFGQVDESPIFILGTSTSIRRQVVREKARLLEMGCSIETASGGRASSVSIRAENERKLLEARSARSLRLAGFERKYIAIRPTSIDSGTTRANDIETITDPLSEAKSPHSAHKTGEKPAVPTLVNFNEV